MKTLKKCVAACTGLEEKLFLWAARVTDACADWTESRCGRLWFIVPAGRLKARAFRWCAGLDRRFINWLG